MGLVFSISNFFIAKTSLANNWRSFSSSYLALERLLIVFWNMEHKSNIGRPQQPPTERVSDISKKLDSWWSISQKGASIGYFGAKDDPFIRIRELFWRNRALEAVEAIKVAGLENHYWGLHSHPGSWIQPYFDVLKTIFLGWIMQYHVLILASFLFETVKASRCRFFENWLMNLK